MSLPLDARHIANQQGDFVPQHQNIFMLEVAGLDGNDKDLIVLSLMSLNLPPEKNNIITMAYGNEERKVAGRAIFDNVPLKVRDYVDRKVRKAIQNWRKQVYDQSTGAVGLPSKYKKTGEIIMQATDGTLSRSAKLIGLWPSEVNNGSLNMDSDAPVEIEITLTYDRAEWIL